MSRFRKKEVLCKKCNQVFCAYEEKESDVALGVKLYELCHKDEFDTAFLVTGDTDFLPAVRTCMDVFPTKTILFLFPYKRMNRELESVAPLSITLKPKQYISHHLPNPVVLDDGTELYKPKYW